MSSKKTVGIVGYACSLGQPREGTELGPRALRDGGLIQGIEELDLTVVDHGDVSHDDPNYTRGEKVGYLKNPTGVGQCSKKYSDAIAKSLKLGHTVVALGGDHTMAIGSIHGHAQAEPDLVVLWVDAHADINTPLTTESGNIHGMPLSFLVKELEEFMPKTVGFEWIKPCLSAKDLVYIGLRDVDPKERHILERLGITCYSMHEVEHYGLPKVMEMALQKLDPNFKRPIHVSFDVDGIDPKEMPSTGTPVIAGLTLREAFYIAEEVYKTDRLSVLDIAEVNPLLGNKEQQKLTVSNSVELTARFFGKRRQGTAPPGFQLTRP